MMTKPAMLTTMTINNISNIVKDNTPTYIVTNNS